MNKSRSDLARQFIEAIPHSRALGMKLTEIGDGSAEITMPYDERLIGDPATGVIHGGAVSALMDTCGGAAVMSHPSERQCDRDIGSAHRLHARRDPGPDDHGAGRPVITSRAAIAFVARRRLTKTGTVRSPRPPAPLR